MKKVVPVIIVLALVVGVLAWAGGSKAALPTNTQMDIKSVITAMETVHDFGTIGMYDGDVMKRFEVTNPTDKPIEIDSVVTSCMCTTAYIINGEERKGPYGMPGHGVSVPKASEMVASGETRIIEVVFDPAAHGPAGVGMADRSVYLVDETGGVLELQLTSNVVLEE